MIPKIIHFCWFSDSLETVYPDDVRKCMNSWKEKLPDYEIRCWNEKNFDASGLQYTKEALASKKYAFVSDYVRLFALYNYGGIYLDSDVEVFRNFDDLLQNQAFTGFEEEDRIATWILGSEKGNPLFRELMDDYKERRFLQPDGSFDLTPNPVPLTKKMMEHGLALNNCFQKLDCITVYPMDYFCPFNPYRVGKNLFTDHTYTNHHFNGSWKSGKERIRGKIKILFQKVFGKKMTDKIICRLKSK